MSAKKKVVFKFDERSLVRPGEEVEAASSFDAPPCSETRTEMRCRICGGFSSAQTCWSCTNNPLLPEVERLRTALQKILNYPVHSEPVGGAMAMQDIAHEALSPNEKLTHGPNNQDA